MISEKFGDKYLLTDFIYLFWPPKDEKGRSTNNMCECEIKAILHAS